MVNGNEKKKIELTTESELVVLRESNCCVVLTSVFSLSFLNITPAVLPNIPVHGLFLMDIMVIDWAGKCKLIKTMKLASSPGNDGVKGALKFILRSSFCGDNSI